MNQKGFTPVFILVGFLVILAVGVGGFLIYNTTTKEKVNQQPSPSPRSESGFRQTKTPPNTQPTPQTISTVGWTTYTNPEFGYSLKIPPELREKTDSNNEQKRFRFYGPQGNSSDELGRFEAELQILTLSYDNQAVKGTKEEFDKLRELPTGAKGELDATPYTKIKNVDLDGCDASQFFLEGSIRLSYSTGCSGDSRYISLVLYADATQQNLLEKYKPIYDAVVASFKFNQFRL